MTIDPNAPVNGSFPGLTIRAEFAKTAMQGLLSARGTSWGTPESRTREALIEADTMIAALNRPTS